MNLIHKGLPALLLAATLAACDNEVPTPGDDFRAAPTEHLARAEPGAAADEKLPTIVVTAKREPKRT